MIQRNGNPAEVAEKLGIHLHRGRAKEGCPICGSTNPTAFGLIRNSERFHCFVCGWTGDGLDLIQAVIKTDFAGALRWLGLKPGRPPEVNPAVIRNQQILIGLEDWARERSRELRILHRAYFQLHGWAADNLKRDPENPELWLHLATAGRELSWIERTLDVLDADDPQAWLSIYQGIKTGQLIQEAA